MSERDAALDFIYKGFRDGRRQKAAKRFQRGNERLASTLAPMGANVRTFIPNVASAPPSAASLPPSNDSSASPANFADDVTTADDESTPFDESRALPEPKVPLGLPGIGESSHASNRPVEETVSSPPRNYDDPLNDKIHSNMMPSEGIGRGPPPPPAELKTPEPPKKYLTNEKLVEQYDQLAEQIKEKMRNREIDFREGTRQLGLVMDSREQAMQRNLPKIEDLPPGRPPKKVEIPPETGSPVRSPQDVKPEPLEPKPADSKSDMSRVMEAANELTAERVDDIGHLYSEEKPEGVPSEEPVELISRDEPDEAFETAYEEMTQPEPEPEPAPEPKLDPKVAEVAPKAIKPSKKELAENLKVEDLPGRQKSGVERKKELESKGLNYADYSRNLQAAMSGNENSLQWLRDNPESVKEFAKDGLPQRIKDYLGVKKTPKKSTKKKAEKKTEKKTTKRTPTKAEKDAEPKLKDLPSGKKKKITPPKKKATSSGKKKLEAAAKKLDDDAEAAMTGKKPPKSSKKKRVRQDLSDIEKPKSSDVRRSADEQMLADVLLKKLPVADLRMLDQALGGDRSVPVLIDEMGFPTLAMGVDPQHTIGMSISDNPNPMQPTMDPALRFPLGKLKTGVTIPSRLPGTNYKSLLPSKNAKIIENLTEIPMRMDSKGSMVEDEDIGFFIQDGDKKRRLTAKDLQGVNITRPTSNIPKFDFTTPFWDDSIEVPFWNSYLTQTGKTNTLPQTIGMMQTREDADPGDFGFYTDPRANDTKGVLSDVKELASMSPAAFKKLINAQPKTGFVRAGDSVINIERLIDLVSGMTPSNMANEDIVISGAKDVPLFAAGRGVKRFDEEPTFFDSMIAPLVGESYNIEDMQDILG